MVFPLAAYHGLIEVLFTVEGVSEEMTQNIIDSVHQAFPCVPNIAYGEAAPLLTECIDVVADFINAYLFTCPIGVRKFKFSNNHKKSFNSLRFLQGI